MKTVIVTGAGGNLGQAVVKKFIAEGCRVIGTVTKKVTISPNLSSLMKHMQSTLQTIRKPSNL